MKDEYATHPEDANDGVAMMMVVDKIKSSSSTDEEEERHSAQSHRSESPSYHTGSSEPSSNDLISPPMGGSVDATDRRLRRQIANCNERRRMQSINAGFQSLKLLLPRRDGEKLSKAAILQHTVELIQTLRAEKMKLIEEKEAVIYAKKRKLQDDSIRERGVIDELTAALEHERRLRHLYERMFNLWANSPVLSQFLSKPNTSVINPAIALPNVLPPTALQQQTRGFTGLLPPALLIDSLLNNARIGNNGGSHSSGGCGGGGGGAAAGTGTGNGGTIATSASANATFDLGLLTGNLVAAKAAAAAAAAAAAVAASDDVKSLQAQSVTADLLQQPSPFLISSLDAGCNGANLNPNFYTILEAIRQLEESAAGLSGAGGGGNDPTTNSGVNQQQQQQQPNVLVR